MDQAPSPPYYAFDLSSGYTINTVSISPSKAAWQQRTLNLSHIIREGNLHIALLVLSALFTIPHLITIIRSREHVKSGGSIVANSSTTAVTLSILSQLVTAAAFASSVIELVSGNTNLPESIVLCFIFLLGVSRITIVPVSSSWRLIILHYVNTLLLATLLLAFGKSLLPFLIIDTFFRVSVAAICEITCLAAAVLIAFVTPRAWAPPPLAFDLVHRSQDAGPSPEETCSWFSYFMSYGWMTSILTKGAKVMLDYDDLLPLPYYDEPLIWLGRITIMRQRWKSTFATMIAVLYKEIGRQVIFAALTATTEFLAPIGMYKLLHHLEDPSDSVVNPLCWIVLLFIGPVARSVSFQQYIFASTRLVVRNKMSLVQELYCKALRSVSFDATALTKEKKLDKDIADQKIIGSSKTAAKSGHISNLMSYDVDALAGTRDIIYVVVSAPIEIIIAVFILYHLLGWASLVGLSVLLSSFPWAAWLSSRLGNAQKSVMMATDKRIALISEYLSSIRTIKFFAWEKSMSKNIEDARAEEQKHIWRRSLYSMAITVSGDFAPLLTLYVMFLTYTLGTRHDLNAAVAFTSLSVIEALRTQFVWISNAARMLAQGKISCQRIDEYFATAVECQRPPVGPPSFKNATFRRTPVADFRLHNLNIDFLEGRLNIIMGPSACGKSSLLLSLIGETILESGNVSCPADVAYASQSAWLMNDTIRNNIVFYQDFETSRYDAVLEACGLVRDLEQLDEGDQSKVGDNGSTLSGGQRQRIALARAFYSKSPLLLLDDIFSALDVETAAHVWKNAFHGFLVEGRTIILVTQQQWLAHEADLAITMNGGEIAKVEHHNHSGREKVVSTSVIDSPSRSSTLYQPLERSQAMKETGTTHLKQEVSQVRNDRTLAYQYMYMFGGHSYAILVLLVALSAQVTFFGITLWLGVWVGRYSKDQAVNVGFYLAVYATILSSFTILSVLKSVVFQWGAWRAARSMHNRLVKAVMAVSVDWYDANPAGRVINRFSQDIFSVDMACVDYLRQTTDNALRLVLRIGGVGSIMPIFALPAALVCTIGFAVGELYTKSQLPVRKMLSAANSPLFSQFQDTMNGLSVIRARGMEDVFADVLARRLRTYGSAAETLFNLNRWVSVRADASAALVAFMAGLLALYKSGSVSPGLVGFSLTNAIGLSTTILYLVRNMNELEIELNCFHRVREYADLVPEESIDFEATRMLHKSSDGEPVIEFRNVTARYSGDGPEVLKDVSFKIRAGERIAIVGRTGSGKSTTALCLLRFVHISSGSILIDGIDISRLALAELRSEVTMIPQEPVLFSGTVQSNLDPTRTINEEVISRALQSCSSISAISTPHKSTQVVATETLVDITSTDATDDIPSPASVPHVPSLNPVSRIQLTTHISPKGDNLSQGERQILGVARAIARQSKIVLMDEATASVDYESDKAIQAVLRREFAGKTVITIAHRLKSIMDYDRVLVFSDGRLVELDTPKELFRRKGIFWNMCLQSAESADLIEYLDD